MKKPKILAICYVSKRHYKEQHFFTEKYDGPWTDVCEDYSPFQPGKQDIYNYGSESDDNADKFFVPSLGELSSDDDCEICLENMNNGIEVSKITRCVHKFHTKCIRDACKTSQHCPICRICRPNMEGSCPPGQMVWEVSDELKSRLACHEHDEQRYSRWQAPEPRRVLQRDTVESLLAGQRARQPRSDLFKQTWKIKRTFMIGRSLALNCDNSITWNDIHHKTSIKPNDEFGYPDATYLKRVVEDIKAMGVQ